MIRIRPYKASDADTILSWCQDEKAFYQWTAGILGNYPITQNEFCFVESLMPFTAFDETGIVGFFTLRNPDESPDELRFGFVIVNPHKRGKGYGKAFRFKTEIYGNNDKARDCSGGNVCRNTSAVPTGNCVYRRRIYSFGTFVRCKLCGICSRTACN